MFIFIYILKVRGEKCTPFDIAPGSPSAVDATKTCVSPSTNLPVASNIAQPGSSVKLDLKLECENTSSDSLSVGIGVQLRTSRNPSTMHDASKSANPKKERWTCQYYIEEKFNSNSKQNVQLCWSQVFCIFSDKTEKSSVRYMTLSEDYRDPD